MTQTFNPSRPPPPGSITNMQSLYNEPLLDVQHLQPTKAPIPWLATGYTWSNGGKTLTFTIRSGRQVQRRQAVHRQRRGVHLQLLMKSAPGARTPRADPDAGQRDGPERHHGDAEVRPAAVREPVPDRARRTSCPQHIWGRWQPGHLRGPQPGRHRPVRCSASSPRRGHVQAEPVLLAEGQVHVPEIDLPEYVQHQRQPGPPIESGSIDWAGNDVTNVQSDYLSASPDNHTWTSSRRTSPTTTWCRCASTPPRPR